MRTILIACTLSMLTALPPARGESAGASSPEQDYRVVKDGDQFAVLGIVDNHSFFSSESARQAIQFAIDKLGNTGGQVVISRGDYTLDEPLNMKERVHLLGSGRATRLRVSESNAEGIGIVCKQINGFMISNLAVTAGNNPEARVGILIDDCGDSKVRDVFCVGFSDYGIHMRQNSFLMEINGCHLAGNKKANLYMQNMMQGRYGNFIPNLLSNCVIYGGGKGIELNRVNVMNILGCLVYHAGDAAFHVHSWSNSVLITGCRTFQITGPAVLVEGSHEFNCTGNIFCWHTEQGILLKNVRWGNITGNEFIDNGSYNSGEKFGQTEVEELPDDLRLYDGIEMIDVHGCHVGGNTIFNWEAAPRMRYGISEDDQSFKNTIANNNINYYSGADVVSNGKESAVHGNVSFKDRGHMPQTNRRFIQSFRTELTEEYIDLQK